VASRGSTPSQTVGPFFEFGLVEPQGFTAAAVAPDTPEAVTISGRVTDGDGAPVPDAMLELWQAEPDGSIGDGRGLFARSGTDGDGRWSVTTVKPGATPGQAPHIAVDVFARGLLRHLVTRIYFPDEGDANAADPVLAAVDAQRRGTLVAEPDGEGLRFDVRLQGDGETVFFDV
jgi:protocatechuate 3,4-dioxygenase, alpha subunit